MLLLAAVLEELHRTLMLFGCRASLEGAEVSPPPGVRIGLARVQPIPSGFQLADHALRDEVERSDSREARIDLKPITESYLDVEREMGGYPERQARADDRHERY